MPEQKEYPKPYGPNSRPKLDPELKGCLLLELITWANVQDRIWAADTPQGQLLRLCTIIADDFSGRMGLNRRTVLSQVLRKSPSMLQSVRPFLYNDEGCECGYGNTWHTEEGYGCTWGN